MKWTKIVVKRIYNENPQKMIPLKKYEVNL